MLNMFAFHMETAIAFTLKIFTQRLLHVGSTFTFKESSISFEHYYRGYWHLTLRDYKFGNTWTRVLKPFAFQFRHDPSFIQKFFHSRLEYCILIQMREDLRRIRSNFTTNKQGSLKSISKYIHSISQKNYVQHTIEITILFQKRLQWRCKDAFRVKYMLHDSITNVKGKRLNNSNKESQLFLGMFSIFIFSQFFVLLETSKAQFLLVTQRCLGILNRFS